ncbi:MAG: DUF721 domain-containing protein [Phycisphaeraceae bacterium]|nr:DUF721 domain-containing protein [Phycisphaeraceae bacterium]
MPASNSDPRNPRNPPNPRNAPLDRLRRWRNIPDRDQSLAFLKDLFKRQVERPHRQLAAVIPLWQSLVPPDLQDHTQLLSFSRGILHVAVDSSSPLYELSNLLRHSLERQLITQCRSAPLRKIRLQLTPPPPPPPPVVPHA